MQRLCRALAAYQRLPAAAVSPMGLPETAFCFITVAPIALLLRPLVLNCVAATVALCCFRLQPAAAASGAGTLPIAEPSTTIIMLLLSLSILAPPLKQSAKWAAVALLTLSKGLTDEEALRFHARRIEKPRSTLPRELESVVKFVAELVDGIETLRGLQCIRDLCDITPLSFAHVSAAGFVTVDPGYVSSALSAAADRPAWNVPWLVFEIVHRAWSAEANAAIDTPAIGSMSEEVLEKFVAGVKLSAHGIVNVAGLPDLPRRRGAVAGGGGAAAGADAESVFAVPNPFRSTPAAVVARGTRAAHLCPAEALRAPSHHWTALARPLSRFGSQTNIQAEADIRLPVQGNDSLTGRLRKHMY